MAKTVSHVICKNVFKNIDHKTIQTVFTQKFIELINQLEKSKGIIKPK